MLFLTCSWRFLISNKLEQLEFTLEKIIGISKHAGKVRKNTFLGLQNGFHPHFEALFDCLLWRAIDLGLTYSLSMQSITESSKVPEGVMMNWASLAKKLKPNTGGYHSGSKLKISSGNSLGKI